jgi:hypothetical protein
LAWWWAAECRQSDPFSFNLSTFGYIWIGVRAQNLLRWMTVEHRCGLGVQRVSKDSQSHLLTDDGRTLGRDHLFGFGAPKTNCPRRPKLLDSRSSESNTTEVRGVRGSIQSTYLGFSDDSLKSRFDFDFSLFVPVPYTCSLPT